MRRITLAALLAMGCAGDDEGLDTAAMFAAFDEYGPPAGVTETRYKLDCTTLPAPVDVPVHDEVWAAASLLPEPAAVPGYIFDFEDPPLSAMLYRRLDPEARAWMEADGTNPNDVPVPADVFNAQIPVDSAGRAVSECLFLASTAEAGGPMFGWITEIELIVWTADSK